MSNIKSENTAACKLAKCKCSKNESAEQFFTITAEKPYLWPSTFPGHLDGGERSGQSRTEEPCFHHQTRAHFPLAMRSFELVSFVLWSLTWKKSTKAHRSTGFLSLNQGLLLLWSTTGLSKYIIICPGNSSTQWSAAWANSLSDPLDDRKRWQIWYVQLFRTKLSSNLKCRVENLVNYL